MVGSHSRHGSVGQAAGTSSARRTRPQSLSSSWHCPVPQSTYGPLKMGLSPYGLAAITMSRVPGLAFVTVNPPPGPSSAICDRPALAFVRADGRLPLEHPYERVEVAGSMGLENAPPSGSSTSIISPAVPSSTGEPSPTRTRTMASPSWRVGMSSGRSTCDVGSTSLSRRARFTQNRTPRISPTFPSRSSSAPMPSACHTPRPVRIFRSDPGLQPRPLDRAAWTRWCDPCSRSPTGCTRDCRTRDGGGAVSSAARSGVIGTTASCTRMNGIHLRVRNAA